MNVENKIAPKISSTVSKLGSQIFSINLPQGITCRPDAPCMKGCYAKKGRFNYPNVKTCLANNLESYKTNPDFFFSCVIHGTALCKFVRWHSSGDIVDYDYFLGMIKVAKTNKDVKYLCFTKKYEIVNQYLETGKRIPTNLKIVFSNWNEFVCENPFGLPTSWVRGVDFNDSLIPKLAIPCGGKCHECLSCWNLKKGQSVYFKKH